MTPRPLTVLAAVVARRVALPYEDLRRRPVDADPEDLWRVVEGIGGERGWYSLPLAWAARGRLDRLVGGVGLRRGRRDPDRLLAGEPVDFWCVEEVVDGARLRLRAEMRLPGAAWLELQVDRDQQGRTLLVQRALFSPRGLAGHAYWWAVAPFHGVVHASMLAGIADAAQDLTRTRLSDQPPHQAPPAPDLSRIRDRS